MRCMHWWAALFTSESLCQVSSAIANHSFEALARICSSFLCFRERLVNC